LPVFEISCHQSRARCDSDDQRPVVCTTPNKESNHGEWQDQPQAELQNKEGNKEWAFHELHDHVVALATPIDQAGDSTPSNSNVNIMKPHSE
jgi:hypothetical protein